MGRSRNESKREVLGKHQSGTSPTTSARSSTEHQASRVDKPRAHAPSKGHQGPAATSGQSGDDLHQSTSPPTTQLSPEASERKSKLRLRNREAAQKCRKRKQRGIEELQSQEVAVEALHNSLLTEASQLQQEVLILKNMVLDHGACDCAYIEEYIQEAASNLVQQDGGSGGVNFASDEDGQIKVEGGTPEQGFFTAEGYSLDNGERNQPIIQQPYENSQGPGAGGMGMGMSPLALQGQPTHNLGLHS